MKKKVKSLSLLIFLFFLSVGIGKSLIISHSCDDTIDLKEVFANPIQRSGTVTLYWLNGVINRDTIRTHIELLHKEGFTGIAPLPLSRMKPPVSPTYLSNEYMDLYGFILDELRQYDMELIFYDDCDFPSGTAGGRLAKEHPEMMAKYLLRVDTLLNGGAVSLPVPRGKLMSACLSVPDSCNIEVITSKITVSQKPTISSNAWQDTANFTLPEGKWRVQLFFCVVDPRHILVDGLDPVALKKYTEMTYEKYYERFSQHFGSTIQTTFYDDLAYYHVQGARAWTEGFNDRFMTLYGISPEALYPSLFEDTGSQTGKDRIQLFSTRDQLNAEGYPKILSEWANTHNIACSGHPAAIYRPNPLQNMGDGIKYYKYQDIPLCDYIHFFRHGIDGFVIPASAAYNYDKEELICEIYGNFNPDSLNDTNMLFRAGMDVYSRGINRLLPHGTWYDASNVAIGPEISWRNKRMADGLKKYNDWASRCELILRDSRHVAQVGILYPIADLQARYDFTTYTVTNGREHIRGNDYYNFLGLMTTQVRRDYTLIHPEVFDEKCVVKEDLLRLDNKFNYEEYKVMILPWCNTVYASNMEKLTHFAQRGGIVLFVGCLPQFSALPKQDTLVRDAVKSIMASGHGFLIENPDKFNLTEFFTVHLLEADIQVKIVNAEYPKSDDMQNASLETFRNISYACNYIHKVKHGQDFYFIPNPTDYTISIELSFADITSEPQIWDPHTGNITPAHHSISDGHRVVLVDLPPVTSLFVVFGGWLL